MINIPIIIVIAIVTWCVASEGAGGAAITLLSILFAGLLAMSYFEPLAQLLQNNISSSYTWRYRWDFIALVGLFALFVFLIRFLSAKISPYYIHVHPYLYEAGRWGCGLLAGYITMAFLLTALHTAPLPREFIGFKPENDKMFLSFSAPDRQWLGFTQYISERVYPRWISVTDQSGQAQDSKHIFDGRTRRYEGVNLNKETENEIFSSFILRYATRRDQMTKGESLPGLQRSTPSSSGQPGF